MFFDQSHFSVRCEWGLAGIQQLGPGVDILIIVDALSFSTCVDVATSRGAIVYPCRWKDARASELAAQAHAELAGPRNKPGRYSLSPGSMLAADPNARIVLPSPNGSELTIEGAAVARVVLAGCFRNCRAVAQYACKHGQSIAVIPCGERWPDGSLRPAVEDFWAAGSIIEGLPGPISPEAHSALAAWRAAKNNLPSLLTSCSSGRQLVEAKYAPDVELAGEIDVSQTVPIFDKTAYQMARE